MAFMSQEHKKRIKALLDQFMPNGKHGWKWTLSVRHHSTLLLTIQQAPVDLIAMYQECVEDRGGDKRDNLENVQLHLSNVHRMFLNYPEIQNLFDKMVDALNLDNYDRSDSQSDYYCVGHYAYINIGTWDKPFRYVPKASTPPADNVVQMPAPYKPLQWLQEKY